MTVEHPEDIIYSTGLDSAQARAEATERVLNAAEEQARRWITYLPGPHIEYDDPRRAKWKLVGEQLQRDIALISDRCFAVIYHGPGHQSTARCEVRGEHDKHRADAKGGVLTWTDEEGSTGFFDEQEEDDE